MGWLVMVACALAGMIAGFVLGVYATCLCVIAKRGDAMQDDVILRSHTNERPSPGGGR